MHLKASLSWVIMLVNHQILEHRVLVLNLLVDLLVEEAHSVVRVLAAYIGLVGLVLLPKEDIRETRLVTMLTRSKHDPDPLILI